MKKYINILTLLLLVNSHLFAQDKFHFNNTKGSIVEVNFIKSDSIFYLIEINSDLEIGMDSLFSSIEFAVIRDTIFYRSTIDKTQKVEIFLTSNLSENISLSYTKNNTLLSIDGTLEYYYDSPSSKNVASIYKKKYPVSGYAFGICDISYPIFYFRLESQYHDNYSIGFIPDIGIVAFGYSISFGAYEPIDEIFYLDCSSFDRMKELWKN